MHKASRHTPAAHKKAAALKKTKKTRKRNKGEMTKRRKGGQLSTEITEIKTQFLFCYPVVNWGERGKGVISLYLWLAPFPPLDLHMFDIFCMIFKLLCLALSCATIAENLKS